MSNRFTVDSIVFTLAIDYPELPRCGDKVEAEMVQDGSVVRSINENPLIPVTHASGKDVECSNTQYNLQENK
jgi:hypothetical protein